MNDIEFTFSELPFIRSIEKISQGMTRFEEILKKTARKGTDAFTGLFKKTEKQENQFMMAAGKAVKSIENPVSLLGKSIVNKMGEAGRGVMAVIQKIDKALYNLFNKQHSKKLPEHVKKGTENSTDLFKKFTDKSSQGINSLITRMGALGVAYFGARALLARLPEVGKTWEIVSDIFFRNFLWPLRKELVPYLQKILNWARDNRTQFLVWGQNLVNVFRAAVQIIKAFWGILSPIFQATGRGIQKIFGTTGKSISDTFNILLFRVTVIALAIIQLLKPVYNWLANRIDDLAGFASKFIDGFFEGIGDLIPAFDDLLEVLDMIYNDIAEMIPEGEMLGEVFSFLGDLLGTAVTVAVQTLASALDVLWNTLKLILSPLKVIFRLMQGDGLDSFKELSKASDNLGESLERGAKRGEKTIATIRGLETRTRGRLGNIEKQQGLSAGSLSGITPDYNKPRVDLKAAPVSQTKVNTVTINSPVKIELKPPEGMTPEDANKLGEEAGKGVKKTLDKNLRDSVDKSRVTAGS